MLAQVAEIRDRPRVSAKRLIPFSLVMSGLYFAIDISPFASGLFSIDGLARLLVTLSVGGIGLLLINPLLFIITLGYTAFACVAALKMDLALGFHRQRTGLIIGTFLLAPLLLMDADFYETILVLVIGSQLGHLCVTAPQAEPR